MDFLLAQNTYVCVIQKHDLLTGIITSLIDVSQVQCKWRVGR